MSNDQNCPAFPAPEVGVSHFGDAAAYPGLTKRQYAAIHLRLPDSGDVWLDDMIRRSIAADIETAVVQPPQVTLEQIDSTTNEAIRRGLEAMRSGWKNEN